jgi:hypothetical protein
LTVERPFGIIPRMVAADPNYFPRDAPSIYRQFFTPAECRLIDSTPLTSALSEISLLRIMLLRILAAAHRAERLPAATAHSDDMSRRSLTLEQRLSMLKAFSQAGLVLAALASYHHHRFPPTNCLLDALDELDPDDL